MFYSFPALVPAFESDLGWPRPQVMGAYTLALLSSALVAPFGGALIDRGLGPILLPGAAALGGLGLIAASVSTGPVTFYAAWAFIGMTQALALYEATFSLLVRVRGAEARAPITTITLVAGFAGTLAFPLCAWLSADGDWRLALRVMSMICLFIGLPLTAFAWSRLGPGVPDEPAPPGTPSFLRRPVFWALGATFLLLSVHAGTVVSHILPLLADRGVAPGAAVLAASLLGPMQIAGRVFLLAVGRGHSERVMARGSMISILVALPTLAAAGVSWPLIGIFVLLHGAGIGMLSILRPLVIRDVLGPRNFARMSGTISAGAMLGFAIAPTLGAMVYTIGGYDLVLGMLAFILILAIICLGLAFRKTAA